MYGSPVTGAGRSPVSSPSVALCVLTLNRPRSLTRCLEGIARLEPVTDLALRVIVVDNDEKGSAGEVVDRVRAGCPWPIEYVIEPQLGVPQARNRAVMTSGDVDAVAFIDDDEMPQPGWLRSIVGVWDRTGADVVQSRLIPTFDDEPPKWVIDGQFFEPERFPDASSISYLNCGTSGVLIRRSALPAGPEVFDPRFRFTGGEDTELFERMSRAGCEFAWADNALVDQIVPATRATVGWHIRRAYMVGNHKSMNLLTHGPGPMRRARRGIAAMAYGLIAVAKALPRLSNVQAGAVHIFQLLAEAAGEVAGIAGIHYKPYVTLDGS
jgi:succinoglycan biosynthesis protein ExoM